MATRFLCALSPLFQGFIPVGHPLELHYYYTYKLQESHAGHDLDPACATSPMESHMKRGSVVTRVARHPWEFVGWTLLLGYAFNTIRRGYSPPGTMPRQAQPGYFLS